MARGTMPEECVECSSPLRKKGETLEANPDTKVHFGQGLCSSCHGMNRPSRKLSARTLAKIEANRQGLSSFLAERQKREQKRNKRAKLHMVIR